MKRTLLAVTLFALFLPIARQAAAADVSVDLFYNNLSGGNWVEVEGYGYGWQPDVAVSNANWRPYSDGYWAYTDVGWTWVSYEDFGWATYHYGRWSRLADYGWIWFPGSDLEWGPAWVSWRVGGGYCGWAPLPPRGPGIAFSAGNIGFGVDVEFDIGPAYYNFIDVRYIGEPVLRDRIFAPTQNFTYINQTVNVTNITTTNNIVYNYGPDYNALSAQSSRPIQRLSIERQQNVDASTAIKSGAMTKVQGDKFVVAAPTKIQKPAKSLAPPTVKTKVAQPKVEKGWAGVPNEAELKQKIKTEDHKKIPPPAGPAAAGAAAPMASASPITSPVTGGASVAPFERGKARGRPAQGAQPAASPAPALSPAQGMASPVASPPGKHKGRPAEPAGQPAQPARGLASPTAPPSDLAVSDDGGPQGKGKGKAKREASPPVTGPESGAAPNQPPGKHRGPPATTPTPYSGGGPGAGAERATTVKSSKSNTSDRIGGEGAGPTAAPAATNLNSSRSNIYRGAAPGGGQAPQGEATRHKPPAAAAPASPAAAEHGPGKPEGGKKHKEASPTPSP
jgi:hypothetical protein